MARPRRRRIGESIEGEESILDDDLESRIIAVEDALEEIQAANTESLKDFRLVRAKVEKLAREFEEGSEGDDELFQEIDALKQAQASQLAQMGQAHGVLTDRVVELTERLAAVPAHLEERMTRLQRQLEATREEELDLVTGRLEELNVALESSSARLRQELQAALEDRSQTAALTEDFKNRLEAVSSDVDRTLGELSARLKSSIAEVAQQQQSAKQELEATLSELADAVDSRASSEDVAELRQEFERLQANFSTQSELGARAASAVAKVEQLEGLLTAQGDRFEQLLSRSQNLAQETDKYADKVDLAVRLVKALDEKGRGGGGSDMASSMAVTTVSDSELEAPEKTDFGFGLRDLLNVMAQNQASDLHIKFGATPMVRLHGDLIPVGNHSLGEEDCRRLIFAALSKDERRRLLQSRCLDFLYEQPNLRLRGHAFYQRNRLCASLRLLRSQMPSLEELGLPAILRRTVGNLKHGLVLITGPLSAGKSTTLAALVDDLNKNRKMHILTLENPIQFLHQDQQALITQREFGSDFCDPLQAVTDGLKHDPDCLVVDPLGSEEAAVRALAAADSGHLVLASLESPNLISALERLFSLTQKFPHLCDRRQLATNLRAVVSQRLLPRADKSKGLIPAAEVLLVNPVISHILADGNWTQLGQAVRQNQAGDGSQTMAQSLTRLLEAGLISETEAASLLPAAPAAAGGDVSEEAIMQWL